MASASTVSANQYRNLQQDVRVFQNLEIRSVDEAEAMERLGRLIRRQQDLNESSPVPSGFAFWLAKRNIKRGAQRYEVDRA